MPNILNGAFHTPLLVAARRTTGTGLKMIVRTEFKQTWMKPDSIPKALRDHARHIVIENVPRYPAQLPEGVHVAKQEILETLIGEEFEPDRPRPGEGHDKTGESTSGAADTNRSKAGPVDLGLLAGKGLQPKEGFASRRPQDSHDTPQLDDRSGITTRPHHLVDAGRAQAGMFIKGLADQLKVWIGDPLSD